MSITPINNTVAMAAGDVIEAMRSIQTESDRWNLADALAVEIPSGLQGFSEIVDRATAEGVAGKLTANTLRLYRDSAVRWPADKRVANVGFSAHREVLPVIENFGIDSAVKMLEDLSKNLGASKVTVAEVRKAVAIKQNKPVPGANKASATATKHIDILVDIKAGSPELIAAISPATESADLDKLHNGLSKAIAHVERLRAKAVRKASASKAATPSASAPAKPSAGSTAVAKKAISKARGDLRGL